jgi:hypothetical protein
VCKADCNRDSMIQQDSGNAVDPLRGRYCSVSDAMKLTNPYPANIENNASRWQMGFISAFKGLTNPLMGISGS